MHSSILSKLARASWGSMARGVWDYNVARHLGTLPPHQLQINVTYRCNARCTMCNIWQMEDRPEMTVDDFSTLLNDSLFASIDRLTIAGGEPSVRADLVSLVEVFLDKMPRLRSLTLITNGLAVDRILGASEAIVSLCTPRKVSYNVSVSLDGVGAIHDRMRNVPGAFERVERCLAGLKELQKTHFFWLGASCVITRPNLYHVRELRQWCAERDIELDFQIVGFHKTYVANLDRRSELDFDEADRQYLFEFMQELASPHSPMDVMSFYWHDMLCMYRDGCARTTPCPSQFDSFVLDAWGDVYYCLSERKIGNCRSTTTECPDAVNPGASVAEPCSAIYYAPENLAFREQLRRTACLRCNSACFANVGIKKDLKGYLWFLLRRSLPKVGS